MTCSNSGVEAEDLPRVWGRNGSPTEIRAGARREDPKIAAREREQVARGQKRSEVDWFAWRPNSFGRPANP